MASLRSVGRATAKGALAREQVTTSARTWRRPAGQSTAVWPKSASARRPGGWSRGMKVSRCFWPGLQIAADLVIAARIAVLVAEAAEQLAGRVPLLARGVFVGGQQGVGGLPEGAEDGGGAGVGQGGGF